MKPDPIFFCGLLLKAFAFGEPTAVFDRRSESAAKNLAAAHPSFHIDVIDDQRLAALGEYRRGEHIKQVNLLYLHIDGAFSGLSAAQGLFAHARVDVVAISGPIGPDLLALCRSTLEPFGYRAFRAEGKLMPLPESPVVTPVESLFFIHERLVPLLGGRSSREIDVGAFCQQAGIIPGGVIHVGAHEGAEWPKYQAMGVRHGIFVEANPATFARLEEKLAGERVTLINCAVTDRAGTITLHLTSFDQSCSIFPLLRHTAVYPDIVETGAVEVRADTLDALVANRRHSGVTYNILALDIQGAELQALRGAVSTLEHVDIVVTEVNFDELYAGCAQIEDMDIFLTERGFARKVTSSSFHPSWGDALYVRPPRLA